MRTRSANPAAGLAALCAFLVALLGPSPVGAICDPPLVVSQGGGIAKVLFILDNSSSMNEAVHADGFDAGVTYTGSFDPARTYTVSAAGSYTPRSFNSSWATTPSAWLVNSDQGEAGQYNGNYLNWVFFQATAAQRAAIPALTRIQLAKQALSTVLAGAAANTQFGVMDFNNDNGGLLVSGIGTAPATINTQVAAIRANAYTPLAETMVTALTYFSQTGAGAPLQASCEKPFIIMITDGYPTKDLNIPAYLQDYDQDGQDPGNCASLGAPYNNNLDCSGYVDDVATYLFKNDLRADLDGMQNARTYVIGFDLDAPILLATATKGGGAYFSVKNPAGLADALSSTFDLIAAQMSASGAVSVVSAEDRSSNRLFRARFESQTWRGFVEAFALPYHAGDSPVWEAGSALQSRSAGSRTVYTSASGTSRTDFTTGNAATLQVALGAVDATDAQQIIDYARGAALTGTRDRGGWKLGDVVDASPLMVGRPGGFSTDLAYNAFRTANASREEMLYVAANDGMLHAFSAEDGTERWAYVPKSVLPRLRDLMSPDYCHEYFVNMTPAAFDMNVGGAWRTVLVGGLERGGDGLFALDVTDPSATAVQVLWDVNLPALKGSWNPPTLVRSRAHGGSVLVAGTGYDATASTASLLAINPADGSVLNTWALGSAVAGNKLTKVVALDMDYDGWDDVLYACDLAGRVWRVALGTSSWTPTLLFNAGRPIQSAPVLTMDELGRVMVFFGTGRYLDASDLSNTDLQSFYGIVDDGSGGTVTTASLVDQTTVFHAVTSGQRGWFVNLVQDSGERITRRPLLVAGTIYVPSFRPNAGVCLGGGHSWLYTLDYKDGSAPTNPDGTENNVLTGRIQDKGAGILADPSVDLVNEQLVLQSSSAAISSQAVNTGLRKLVVRSWRQKWN